MQRVVGTVCRLASHPVNRLGARQVQRTLSVLSIPKDELKDIREELRGYGGTNDNFVALQEASEISPRLSTQLESAAAILTLSNESSRNALTGKMMAELADAVDRLGDCHLPWTALIVRGEGVFFCAGADLGAKEHLLTPEGGRLMSALMTDTLTRLRRLPLITVAAIEGAAIGGGAELATAMDYRIVEPNAHLRFVQALMGVTPGWGGATRLIRLVGRQRALQLLGTAQPLSATKAMEWGLVDRVIAEGTETTMEDELVEFLDPFVHADPSVLHAAKKVVAGTDDAATFEESAWKEHEVFCTMWGGEANLAAVAKASRKRKKK